MKKVEITAAEFVNQSESYLDTAMDGNIVCIEKDGRHVCLLGDEHWRLIVEVLSELLSRPVKQNPPQECIPE